VSDVVRYVMWSSEKWRESVNKSLSLCVCVCVPAQMTRVMVDGWWMDGGWMVVDD
jgi:hypothetical protein